MWCPSSARSPHRKSPTQRPSGDRGIRASLLVPSSFDENPNCARTFATFRLAGDALKPDEVTAALGLSPTHARAKGDTVPIGRKGKATFVQRTGIWLLEASRTASLERHLIHRLDVVEPAADALVALRLRHDLSADFFCYWLSAGGPWRPGALARVARAHRRARCALGIDFYGPLPREGSGT
jgi:Domain of unknown function (DUF4279)